MNIQIRDELDSDVQELTAVELESMDSHTDKTDKVILINVPI